MELLPIIIIVSLLGFFIVLTTVLFTWQYLRAREQRQRQRQRDSESHDRPTRHLTVRSGQVIPKSEAASTRELGSADSHSPRATYTVKCEAERRKTSDTWPPIVASHRRNKSSKATDIEAQSKEAGRSKIAAYTWPPKPAARSQRHPSGVIDLEAQTQDVERLHIGESMPVSRKEDTAKARAKLSPPVLMTERSGSLTLPRPALVTIESRRPSAAKSHDSQSRRTSKSKTDTQSRHPSSSKNREITESLQKAYTGPSVLGGEAHQLPASPILWNSSLHTAESRRASERRSSGRSADGSTVSSRVISDSMHRPPPLFSAVEYSPHVSFAPVKHVSHNDDDFNRVSFLSMTDSASSSYTTEQVSPVLRAPPPSMNDLVQYEKSPPLSNGLASDASISPGFIRDTPPQLGTPDFGNMSFFDSTRSSDESSQLESAKKLQRGVSVMSNRSILTIASSEISSNWTIGNAQVVNIYPSVAQEKDRVTPPYARRLRSKYGRYPRGRGDKALPGIPKSPLWQSDFGDLRE